MNLLRISALFTLLAGISHAVVQAYSHHDMPFYLISFILVGVVQIALAILLFNGKKSSIILWILSLTNIGASVFWALTRFDIAPFIGGVEHVSWLGITVVSLQVISVILAWISVKNFLPILLTFVVGAGLAWGAHAGAMELETHFPELKGSGGHHGGGHHSTMSAEEHSKMMNNHEEKTEETHDPVECNGDSCPVGTEKHTQPVVELPIEIEAEVKVRRNMKVDDSHDKPHGH